MKKLILCGLAAFAVIAAGPSFIFGDAASAATPKPIVTSLTPATGTAAGGTTVVVTGSNLTDPANGVDPLASAITFGGVTAHIVSCVAAPAATCTVTAPAGFGIVDVRVADGADGTSAPTPADRYTYAGAGGPGPIVGYAGLCVDDWLSRTVNFNKIDDYTCNGTNAQKWLIDPAVATHAGGAISLAVLGGCMDVRLSGGANGTPIGRYTCNGTGAQLWSAYVHSQLRNPESGKCLTAVGYGTRGVQDVLSTCKGNPNQRFVLP
jgi:hypothetical protein